MKRRNRFQKGDLVKHKILVDSIGVISYVEDDAGTISLYVRWISWIAKPPAHPLNPINPDNACTLRITAAAGTELAGAYSYSTVNASRKSRFFLYKSSLQRITPSSCTRHGWVRLASMPNIPYCCLP